jgi:hypothetical protein
MADKKPSRQRTKVANGTSPLPGIDGRSLWARRYLEILRALISDAGGDDHITEATRLILKRSAVLAAELERREAAFARDGYATPEDLDLFAKTSAVLTRLLDKTGIRERVLKDVTPSIRDVLAEIAAEKAAKASEPTMVTEQPAPAEPAPMVILPPVPVQS